jgi:bicarbonate transport system permease protein
MTIATKQRPNKSFENSIFSRLQKQFPDLLPPVSPLLSF